MVSAKASRLYHREKIVLGFVLLPAWFSFLANNVFLGNLSLPLGSESLHLEP